MYQNVSSNDLFFDAYGNFIRAYAFSREEIGLALQKAKELCLTLACTGTTEVAKMEVYLSPIKNLTVNLDAMMPSSQHPVTLPISSKDVNSFDETPNPVQLNEDLKQAVLSGEEVLVLPNGEKITSVNFTKEFLDFLGLDKTTTEENKKDVFVFIPVLSPAKGNTVPRHLNFSVGQMKDGVISGNYVGLGHACSKECNTYQVRTVN
ncbi:hypothetical protein SAMN05216474_2593 [Lishizhenia tianjinensis]|uniref:Uncharacterized protein n=1 Tax=Lishizhenia tianjinensis TaxID=477690 RepID=A0A1I7B9H7_9FLAO|nr:hypothetical protein [Lishizhenia tianjinensis]SFT83781.1 hypothetical protein SAMN05216474_2593 [Lishizhenia tianjinensis]